MQLTPEELEAALRFIDTCADGEDYDVPGPMMKRLAALGLVTPKPFGRYEGTPLLAWLYEEHESGTWDVFSITSVA
jgi:hypothetical protein